MRTGLRASVAGVLALLLIGCGQESQERQAEKIIERESGGKVKADISKGKMTLKDAEGHEHTVSMGAAVEVPEGFPKDVLVYKGATPLTAMKGDNGYHLTLRTKDEPKKVADAYTSALKAQGWELEQTMAMPQGTMLHFKKGERTAAVVVTRSDDETMVQVTTQTGE